MQKAIMAVNFKLLPDEVVHEYRVKYPHRKSVYNADFKWLKARIKDLDFPHKGTVLANINSFQQTAEAKQNAQTEAKEGKEAKEAKEAKEEKEEKSAPQGTGLPGPPFDPKVLPPTTPSSKSFLNRVKKAFSARKKTPVPVGGPTVVKTFASGAKLHRPKKSQVVPVDNDLPDDSSEASSTKAKNLLLEFQGMQMDQKAAEVLSSPPPSIHSIHTSSSDSGISPESVASSVNSSSSGPPPLSPDLDTPVPSEFGIASAGESVDQSPGNDHHDANNAVLNKIATMFEQFLVYQQNMSNQTPQAPAAGPAGPGGPVAAGPGGPPGGGPGPDDPDGGGGGDFPLNRKYTAWGGRDNRRKRRGILEKGEIERQQYGDDYKGTVPDLGTVADESEPTLRPQYGLAGANAVIPDTKEQIRSDIEFDLFNLVQPGFGEGVDNKLFLYQEAWKKFIRYVKPFYSPNVWLGPSNYQHPLPWQWQNVKDASDIAKHLESVVERAKGAARLIQQAGESSTHAFGRDVPEVAHSISSSGLPRDKRSVFEPVIHNKDPWQPALDPPGKDLQRTRGWKRPFSALRDPDAPEKQEHNGGPTLRKRRALEVILP